MHTVHENKVGNDYRLLSFLFFDVKFNIEFIQGKMFYL